MTLQSADVFAPRHKFQDDVWGQINVNDLERNVIDTPEFQRLFRTSQLGFVDLVYQTANHTRGAHSIGACHVANLLMDYLDENCRDAGDHNKDDDCKPCVGLPVPISPAERVLIRLGALLHDISHVPLSHDIERKSHKIGDNIKVPSHYGHYEKHDDYEHNPLLYRLLCDAKISVLARVLRSYSQPFYGLLTNYDKKPTHLERFLEILNKLHSEQWNPEQELLPALLFHLLFHEDPKKAEETDAWHRKIAHDYGVEPIPWGLGPPEYPEVQRALHDWWYQPFRHDIIGNTLSADLIDYLRRDCQRLGMDRHIDLHLLNYYVLVPLDHSHLPNDGAPDPLIQRPQWYRCAINLHDSKRNTSRVVLVNDIFRLLDLRHEIHEKAVMHRVVQSANAMLSRALLLLDDKKPQLKDLACLGEPAHALQGEDAFFRGLIEKCAPAPQDHPVPPKLAEKAFSGDLYAPNLTQRQKAARVRAAYSIIRKLIERRVYRPLMIVPGDRAESHFTKLPQGNKDLTPTRRTEYKLRTLATLVDSPYYSRFLLFVSASIESYLQGLFDTRKSLINHIRSVIADGDLCDQAMAVVPSRVVIWTTPYKQLYKDPALVVALQDRLGQIDELIQTPGDGTDEDSSLRDLLGRSIEAADAKYAALWKLYVFISDGLFYSGVLNKLLGLSKDAPASDWHSERLKDCQVLLVRAFEAVENNWHDFCREHDGQDDTKKTQLNRRMHSSHFGNIVKDWITLFEGTTDKAIEADLCNLCGIHIDHYVHAWEPSRKGVDSKCRDIPYKFDSPSETIWRTARGKPLGDRERNLVDFLEGSLKAKSEVLTDREFRDLVDSLDAQAQAKLRAMQDAGADNGQASSFLKELFWGDFPCNVLVPPEANEPPMDTVVGAPPLIIVSDKPAPVSPPTTGPALPTTRRDIKRWLTSEAYVLEPHARKQFTTDNIASIVTFIMEEVAEPMRPDVLIDIRERLANESRKIFHNIKGDGIIVFLRRRWRSDK